MQKSDNASQNNEVMKKSNLCRHLLMLHFKSRLWTVHKQLLHLKVLSEKDSPKKIAIQLNQTYS